MQKIEVNVPHRIAKKLEEHADSPGQFDNIVRRAIEQYLARLDKIDADAEYAKAHGHYPEPPPRFDPYGREVPY